MFFFFFNDTATTEIYTLSLHDALPICPAGARVGGVALVKDRERRLVVGRPQVREEGPELGAREQRLINQGAAREGAHEPGLEPSPRAPPCLADPALGGAASEVERALPRVRVAPT